MAPAAPALNIIHGFETPVASGGEDSDASTSVMASPSLTPRGLKSLRQAKSGSRLHTSGSSSGISALKAQLDKLDLDNNGTRPNLSRSTSMLSSNGFDSTPAESSAASDSDKTEMETYEVSLENDFISPDAAREQQLQQLSKTSSLTPPSTQPYVAVEGGLRTQSILRKMSADDFEPLRCLGKGAFGTVHLVKQKATGRLFAQKQFRKATLTVHKRLVEQTRTERTILESVNRHPFVVKLYYAFQDHEKLYLILEYAQGGELFTHLAMERMFSEETAAFYMAEMILALEHLHTNVRVVYRDLKPENCLLDAEGHLVLTDFGLSKVAIDEDDRCNSVLGTIDYMAPEVIEGKDYGMEVDYWSLGAIGFDLLTGSPPFGGNNHAKIQQNILRQKLQLPYFLGPDAKDLLTRLLRKEPNKRLGANMPKDLKLIKAHRFFRKIDWRKLERREVEPPFQPLITDPELAENFSKEFTDLPLSPVVERSYMNFADAADSQADTSASNGGVDVKTGGTAVGQEMEGVVSSGIGSNPFGGFSFVASQSLLEDETFMF
ncbi:hypothetical protein AAFC00_006062 [Neodothiora populina]